MVTETGEEKAISLLGVPKIDVSPLILNKGNVNEFNDAVRDVINQIGEACRNWGFFYVVGHQINEELIAWMKSESASFINKPKEIKKLIERKENNTGGYFDAEYTKQKIDWKEGWDVEAFEGSLLKDGPFGVNIWPEDMPEFKAAITEYFEEVRNLAFQLLIAVWASLNGDMAYVKTQFGSDVHTSLFRINYYAVCPDPNSHFGVGQHTDAGGLTILLQDEGVTSLQVNRNGVWYDVPPVPNSFVINIGDMTQVWSNGLYQAPLHRVLANKTSERYSFPFFFHPSHDTIVQPLEQCLTKERPLLYRPINWGDFRYQRFAGDYADIGEEVQITQYKTKS